MKTLLFLSTLSFLTALLSTAHAAGPAPDPLIPLSTYFASPQVEAPKISPDGKYLVSLQPEAGVMNLKVDRIDGTQKSRFITHERARSLVHQTIEGDPAFFWGADSRTVLYLQDNQGDENWILYGIDIKTGARARLTPEAGVRTKIIQKSLSHPNELLALVHGKLASGALNPIGDVYRIHLDTMKAALEEKNPGFVGFVADQSLALRIAVAFDGTLFRFFLREPGGKEWKPAPSLSTPSIEGKAFGINEKSELLRTGFSGDKQAVLALDLHSLKTRVIAASEASDVESTVLDPRSNRLLAWADYFDARKWHAVSGEPEAAADLRFLETEAKRLGAEFTVESQSAANDRWIVRFSRSDASDTYQLFSRRGVSRRLHKLYTATPQFDGLPLSRMHSVVTDSSDGEFKLVSYYSLPHWLDPNGTGHLANGETVPMVVFIHGGPTDERAAFTFAPLAQWLNNRGYALLLLNFRGSPGFGQRFLDGEKREWGGKMHQDVLDQVRWATGEYKRANVAGGFADPRRVAIFGGSYGGFESWIGLTKTPDAFACGIPVVGPTNLISFIDNRPATWPIEKLAAEVGDPRTEEGRAFLRSRSPFFLADGVRDLKPILMAYGSKDERVKQNEAEQMYDKLEARGARVTYALFPDEGHGFIRNENNTSFNAMVETFLQGCLGGRAMPLTGEVFRGSSAIVKGAGFIPGLEEALKNRP